MACFLVFFRITRPTGPKTAQELGSETAQEGAGRGAKTRKEGRKEEQEGTEKYAMGGNEDTMGKASDPKGKN
jgi:hypothetical protein|eukprot:3080889-Pyramimonas_sp.AAC.1